MYEFEKEKETIVNDYKFFIREILPFKRFYQLIGQQKTQLITVESLDLHNSLVSFFFIETEKRQKQIVVITQNLYHANQLMADFTGLIPDDQSICVSQSMI